MKLFLTLKKKDFFKIMIKISSSGSLFGFQQNPLMKNHENFILKIMSNLALPVLFLLQGWYKNWQKFILTNTGPGRKNRGGILETSSAPYHIDNLHYTTVQMK